MLLSLLGACVPDVLVNYPRDYEHLPVAHPTYEADVAPIWARRCRACHVGGSARGGLDLSMSGEELLAARSTQAPAMPLVAPGRPEHSYLLRKLEGTHLAVGGAGSPMPVGAGLDPAELATIRAWIADGAPLDDDTARP